MKQQIRKFKMSNTKTIKYKVSCHIHQLKINKNIDFQTKIVWKRHQNKAQTNPVKHAQGHSLFDQTLTLQFNMVYNSHNHLFQQKNTEIVAVIVFQGKIKSGGYVKYNIAENLNNQPHEISKVTIPLSQCPDPNAYIEASFSYERISDEIDMDQPSILNASSADLNMSKIDFHDDKMSQEINKINETIRKFSDLTLSVKKKTKQNKMPALISQGQNVDSEVKTLKKTVENLQRKLQKKEQQIKEERLKATKEIADLEKRIEAKNKEFKEIKSSGPTDQTESNDDYKNLYENAVKEIDELKESSFEGGNLRKSLQLKFSTEMDDVREIAKFDGKQESEVERVEELARHNTELQSKIASMSHKLAQLFNASYEYGGARLLDYLQTSIGLTEFSG